jgi:hypothetical protein
VILSPTGVVIDNGQLNAAGPGKVQVDFGSARSTLVGAGKEVELAVRTLEDFHYKTLSLAVNRPEGGELKLGIGLEGENPAVLDAHPFKFNIALSGRMEPILEAIRAGSAIGANFLQGTLGR